jgi:hypothetical protein
LHLLQVASLVSRAALLLLQVQLVAWQWGAFQPRPALLNTHCADASCQPSSNTLAFATENCKARSMPQMER